MECFLGNEVFQWNIFRLLVSIIKQGGGGVCHIGPTKRVAGSV